jgi:hypothetical protein
MPFFKTLCIALSIASTITAPRVQPCVVSAYNPADDVTTIITPDGEAWESYGRIAPNGSHAVVVFDSMGTASIYDDEIVVVIPDRPIH